MALGTVSFLFMCCCPLLVSLNDPLLIGGDGPVMGTLAEVGAIIFAVCAELEIGWCKLVSDNLN
jgi:hypothetical protein